MHKKITPEQEFFEDPNSFYTFDEAKRYDQSNGMRKTQEELTSILFSILNYQLPIESKILDIGCGTGFSIAYLQSRGYRDVIGIDPSIEMINIAKHKKFNVMIGGFFELSKLKLEPNSFSLIISVSALQWVIANKEEMEIKNIIKKIGKDIFNLLNVDGRCIIQFYPSSELIFEVVSNSFQRCNFNVTKFIYNELSIKKRKFILILDKKSS